VVLSSISDRDTLRGPHGRVIRRHAQPSGELQKKGGGVRYKPRRSPQRAPDPQALGGGMLRSAVDDEGSSSTS